MTGLLIAALVSVAVTCPDNATRDFRISAVNNDGAALSLPKELVGLWHFTYIIQTLLEEKWTTVHKEDYGVSGEAPVCTPVPNGAAIAGEGRLVFRHFVVPTGRIRVLLLPKKTTSCLLAANADIAFFELLVTRDSNGRSSIECKGTGTFGSTEIEPGWLQPPADALGDGSPSVRRPPPPGNPAFPLLLTETPAARAAPLKTLWPGVGRTSEKSRCDLVRSLFHADSADPWTGTSNAGPFGGYMGDCALKVNGRSLIQGRGRGREGVPLDQEIEAVP